MSSHGSRVARVVPSLLPAADTTDDARCPEPGTCHHHRHGRRVYRVPVSALREGDSPRSGGTDPDHVRSLSERLDDLPPVLVHSPTMTVIDGRHRLSAARLRGRSTIDVVYFDGPEQEAFLLAVESNVRHGLPLSLKDRKQAAVRILSAFPQWSNRSVAARVGLDHKTVGSLRRQHGGSLDAAVRLGRDGRLRPLNAEAGRSRAREAIARNPQAPLREIARSAGVSVETARDVRRRMRLPPRSAGAGQRGRVATVADVARAPVATGGRAWLRMEILAALQSLKKDPAIRYSEDGRAIVRWLESRLVGQEDADRVLRIPAHQARKVAAVARGVAANWTEIATRLESIQSFSA